MFELKGLPGGELESALASPRDWIPRYIKTLFLYMYVRMFVRRT